MQLIKDSTIERVKLYQQGARVFRTFKVQLPEEHDSKKIDVEISGLPLSMFDASIKLLLCTHRNEWSVSNIKVGLHVDTKKEHPEPPEEGKIKELTQQLTSMHAQHTLLLGECALIEHMEPPARPRGRMDNPPPASPLAARLALEHFVSMATEKRIHQARQLAEDIRKTEADLAELKDQLRRVSEAKKVKGNEVSKSILATLERRRGESLDVELELSYMIPGARWLPQYTCRIERTGESAKIQMRALVIQNSGEDWNNVHLELSTANAISWTELPKLSSLRIGKAQPPQTQQQGFRPPPKGATALFSDHDNAYTHISSSITATKPFRFSSLGHTDSFPDHLLDWYSPEPVIEPAFADEGGYDLDDEIEEEMYMSEAPMSPMRDMAVGLSAGAPPSPPPAQAYSAMPAPAAPSRSRARKAAPKKKEMLSSFGGVGGGGSPKGGLELPPEQRATPLFQELKLKPITLNATQRGKLQQVSTEDRYMEIFKRSGLVADFSLQDILKQANQRAALAGSQTPPQNIPSLAQSSGSFDYVYATRNRVDVPSTMTYHSIPVDEREASCNLRYVTVPREAQHVFRQARISNPSSAPMLSGTAEIYVGDEYILTTTLPTVAPNETFELGLGVEQAIKCARNTSYREERSGRAVVATAELHHEIRIELVNNLERTIECDVRERIPHPATNAEVVIEEVSVSPAWENYTQQERNHGARILRAGRVWSLTIEPGEQVELLAHYVVKIYANNEVVGGNRREA